MKQQIKLMADYQCWPLWLTNGEKFRNIDPSTLSLKSETIKDLETWANVFDSQLDLNDPKDVLNAKELSEKEWEDFEEEGMRLWKQLMKELGSTYEVFYKSSRSGKLLKNLN